MRARIGKTASVRSQMTKFSSSLVAMEAVGIRSPQYLGYSRRKAGPIFFLSLPLSFPDLKNVPTLKCLSIGTPRNNKFSISSKWKINYL